MGLLSSTRNRERSRDERLQRAASAGPARFAPASVLAQEGGWEQAGDPTLPVLAQLGREQPIGGVAIPFIPAASAAAVSGPRQAPRPVAASPRAAGPAGRNDPGAYYSRREVLREAAKRRKDGHLPVTPGSGPPSDVVGRDGHRLKTMSQAEFDEYDRLHQSLVQFGDRWAEAGPVGGAPVDDEVQQHAAHAWDQYYKQRARGKSVEEAAAWAAMSDPESGGNYREKQERGGPGRGLYQWGDPNPKLDRRLTFEREMKVPIERSTEDQQFQFRDWELNHTHRNARKKIDEAQTAGEKAAAMTLFYEIPDDKESVAIYRAALAEEIARRGRLVEQGMSGRR